MLRGMACTAVAPRDSELSVGGGPWVGMGITGGCVGKGTGSHVWEGRGDLVAVTCTRILSLKLLTEMPPDLDLTPAKWLA